MNDTGRPDDNGLLKYDCLNLWTIRAAQAAGLDQETLCAIMAEAQALAEVGMAPEAIREEMDRRWDCALFSITATTRRWVLWAWWDGGMEVPVAFSPEGWER
jgi:hypothetical protein